MIDAKNNPEFKEIIKAYITKGIGEYTQYFVITMSYNQITSQSEELKIINLTNNVDTFTACERNM